MPNEKRLNRLKDYTSHIWGLSYRNKYIYYIKENPWRNPVTDSLILTQGLGNKIPQIALILIDYWTINHNSPYVFMV